MPKEKPTYTTIHHAKRLALGLSVNEYCVADSIDKLSNNPQFPWCTQSREELGKFICVSKRSAIDIVKRLVEKGVVEQEPATGKVRTTEKWRKTVVLEGGEETSPAVKKVHQAGEETSPKAVKKVHLYNNKDNNTNKEAVASAPAPYPLLEELHRVCEAQSKFKYYLVCDFLNPVKKPRELASLKQKLKKRTPQEITELYHDYLTTETAKKFGAEPSKMTDAVIRLMPKPYYGSH